jgi:hypothetical protein
MEEKTVPLVTEPKRYDMDGTSTHIAAVEDPEGEWMKAEEVLNYRAADKKRIEELEEALKVSPSPSVDGWISEAADHIASEIARHTHNQWTPTGAWVRHQIAKFSPPQPSITDKP